MIDNTIYLDQNDNIDNITDIRDSRINKINKSAIFNINKRLHPNYAEQEDIPSLKPISLTSSVKPFPTSPKKGTPLLSVPMSPKKEPLLPIPVIPKKEILLPLPKKETLLPLPKKEVLLPKKEIQIPMSPKKETLLPLPKKEIQIPMSPKKETLLPLPKKEVLLPLPKKETLLPISKKPLILPPKSPNKQILIPKKPLILSPKPANKQILTQTRSPTPLPKSPSKNNDTLKTVNVTNLKPEIPNINNFTKSPTNYKNISNKIKLPELDTTIRSEKLRPVVIKSLESNIPIIPNIDDKYRRILKDIDFNKLRKTRHGKNNEMYDLPYVKDLAKSLDISTRDNKDDIIDRIKEKARSLGFNVED